MSTLINITPPGAPTALKVRHPLEPLSAEEVREAVGLLKRAGKVSPTTRFVSIALREPDKALVHRPNGDGPPPREALAVLFDNAANACYEATLSLAEGTLLSWTHIPGVQPTMTIDEQVECERAVLSSLPRNSGRKLKEHTGVDDTSLVMVDIWSAGNYGEAEESSRRLARPALLPPARPDRQRLRPADRGPAPGGRPEHDGGRSGSRTTAVWPIPPDVSANYAATAWERLSGPTSSPWRSSSPRGRASRSRATRSAGRTGAFVIGFDAREGL